MSRPWCIPRRASSERVHLVAVLNRAAAHQPIYRPDQTSHGPLSPLRSFFGATPSSSCYRRSKPCSTRARYCYQNGMSCLGCGSSTLSGTVGCHSLPTNGQNALGSPLRGLAHEARPGLSIATRCNTQRTTHTHAPGLLRILWRGFPQQDRVSAMTLS